MSEPLRLPQGSVRALSAAECEAKAAESRAAAERAYSPRLRRWHLREARAWERLAATRSETLTSSS
jgi:hypothetical protein